jgi:23S rRNA pseudouridine1911/1915/1917 synthase
MNAAIKLSSPATDEFWEITVLFEDEHLLALDKPAGLLTSPDRFDLQRPSLMKLLHAAVADGKSWAKQRGLAYLNIAHRLDIETSGVILLARSKPVLVALANLFGAETPGRRSIALVQGTPMEDKFEVNAKIAPHPLQPGLCLVDTRGGKKAHTAFEVVERFSGYALVNCQSLTDRTHQVRVHLRHAGLPVVGDAVYGGRPLLLSRLKRTYRLKPGHTERPLISRAAVHAEQLTLPHPVTGQTVTITAPWPRHLKVAVKYLREFAPAQA